jgi:hypothetical protein
MGTPKLGTKEEEYSHLAVLLAFARTLFSAKLSLLSAKVEEVSLSQKSLMVQWFEHFILVLNSYPAFVSFSLQTERPVQVRYDF